MEPSDVTFSFKFVSFLVGTYNVFWLFAATMESTWCFVTTDHFTKFTYDPELKWPIYRMMAKPIKTLQLHYRINQFLLEHNIRKVLLALDRRFSDFWFDLLFFFVCVCLETRMNGRKVILCTYWLSGRARREIIWLEVPTSWPRAKYFPVRPDLTQAVNKHFIIWSLQCWKFCLNLNMKRLNNIRRPRAGQRQKRFHN